MDKQNQSSTFEGIYGIVVKWLVLIIILLLTIGFFGVFFLSFFYGDSWVRSFLERDFRVMLFIPLSVFLALFIVLLLRFTTGPIEFEGLGFKFRGASGPVVLWIFCFLAIIGGIVVIL